MASVERVASMAADASWPHTAMFASFVDRFALCPASSPRFPRLAGVNQAVYQPVYRTPGAKWGSQRPRETNRFRSLTWGFGVRPLGLEPRTCGLRDRKEPSVRCGIVR